MTGFSYNPKHEEEFEPLLALEGDAEANVERALPQGDGRKLYLLSASLAYAEEEQDIELENPKEISREEVEALYDDYYPRVYGYLLSLGVKREEAQEAAQEVFLQLILRLKDGGQIEKPQGWVIGVAQKLALKLYRDTTRRHAGEGDTDRALSKERVDPAPSQEQHLLEMERMRNLRRALSREREQNRECFLLRAQGFRYKDIAKAMNISEQRAAFIVKSVALRLAVICG